MSKSLKVAALKVTSIERPRYDTFRGHELRLKFATGRELWQFQTALQEVLDAEQFAKERSAANIQNPTPAV